MGDATILARVPEVPMKRTLLLPVLLLAASLLPAVAGGQPAPAAGGTPAPAA
jgi:hypothetical protein